METEDNTLHLDYSIEDAESRTELVRQIIAETPPEKLTPKYLDILTKYILFAMDKAEKQQKRILTDNRMLTIRKHEVSYEGLCDSLENGEDGVHNLISDMGKSAFITQRDPITATDLAKTPELQSINESIARLKEQYNAATGKRKFLLKKQLIDMYQDLRIVRNDARGQWSLRNSHSNATAKGLGRYTFYDHISFDESGNPINTGLLSFFNPDHIEALLCNYSALKEESWGNFENDLYYVMEDLDNLIEHTLKDNYPLYYDLLIYKIDGKTNLEIQQLLYDKHHIRHSIEYISALWRNKIPKLIAEMAQEEYLIWHYTFVERGHWKRCSRCGQIKLAHNKFFSKNKSSKDGWYSLCKECRNAKSKKNSMRFAEKED